MDFSTGPRPQDTFNPPIDNSNEPFMPQLQAWQQALPVCPGLESNDPPGMHPLQKKLANLVYQPWQLTVSEPIMPQVRLKRNVLPKPPQQNNGWCRDTCYPREDDI